MAELELLMPVVHVDPAQGLFDHPHHQLLLWKGRGVDHVSIEDTMTRFIKLYFHLIKKLLKTIIAKTSRQ